MRTDTAGFAQKNLALDKKPRFTIEVAFDFASTDLLYITSHTDCEVPTGATVLYGLVETLSVVSQSLDPIKANSTIGQIAFSATDSLSALTAAINSRYPTTSLRGKRVRVYVGYEGLPWSDYILVQTQIVDKLTFTPSAVYEFSCSDVQRTARKDIFNVKTTNLYETIDGTQTAIRVHDTTELIPVAHGAGYTDGSASLTVGYIKLEDEKVIWREKVETAINATGTDITVSGSTISSITTDLSVFTAGMQIVLSGTASDDGAHYIVGTPTTNNITTSSTFTGAASGTSYGVTAYPQLYQCTRAWFNTKAVKHEVDADTVEAENKPEITEYVYLEMPAIQMLYAVLTGTIYGEGSTLPDHWNLAIDASTFIDTGSFTGIGADLWDTSDATLGFPARLGGQEKIDGKKFYEQQLCRLTGTFLRVRADGTLSLKRMTSVLNDSAFVVTLTDDHITDLGNLVHDMTSVYNQFQIDWNWDDVKKKYTRGEQIVDQTSISAHGAAAVLTDQYKTLHGSSHTKVALYSQFDSGRDRYAGPPYRTNIGVQHRFNALEVGEIVRLKTSKVRNCVTGSTADLSMEIQKITVDWLDGIKLELFGSSQKADPISQSALTQVMDNAYYTSEGTNLATFGGITKTDVAGVLTITAGTLTGDADMNAAGAIYYYDGDITIPAGDTLFITQNVQIRYTGTISVYGRIDGVGGGLAGGAHGASTSGLVGLGVTYAGGGIVDPYEGDAYHPPVPTGWYHFSYPGYITGEDAPTSVSYPALVNNSTSLLGIPSELRGTSGGPGGWIHFTPGVGIVKTSDGGNGGAGGAGLALVGRGAVSGVNTQIDLSGAPGAEGGAPVSEYSQMWVPGSGAGGAPGGLLVLSDGTLTVNTLAPYFVAEVGATPTRGTPMRRIGTTETPSPTDLNSSYFTHGQDHDPSRGTISRAQSMFRAQYIPANLTPEEDAPEEAPVAASISISESAGTKNSINIVGLNISAVPPSSGAYRGSMIYISLQGVDAWTQVGEARLTANVVAWVPADNSTYTIRAFPVSIDGVESLDYIESSHAVGATQVSVIPTGNTLATDADVTTNGGVRVDTNGIDLYDATGQKIFDADANDGTLILGVVATEKYMKFDPTAGTLKLGLNTQLLGASAYGNDNIYMDQVPSSYLWYDVAFGGSWTRTLNQDYMQLSNGTAETNVEATTQLVAAYSSPAHDWGNNRRAKWSVRIDDSARTTDYYVTSGSFRTAVHTGYIGFRFDQDGSVYAVWGIATATNEQSLVTFTLSTVHTIEYRFVSGTEIEFWVNGTLEHTATTTAQFPVTATTGAEYPVNVSAKKFGSGSSASIVVGSIRFLQET